MIISPFEYDLQGSDCKNYILQYEVPSIVSKCISFFVLDCSWYIWKWIQKHTSDSQISESLSKSTILGETWYFLKPLTFLPRLLVRDQRKSFKNDLNRYMFSSLSNSLLQLEKLWTKSCEHNFARMVKLKDFSKI